MAETRVPALGAEGWFTEEGGPALVGSRCTACGTTSFPRASYACPNPRCGSTDLEDARLASTGTVWSYTDARYQPPPPFVPATDPYEPFGLAAVELDGEGLVVLGQVAEGFDVTDLHVGKRVALVIEPLFVDEDGTAHLVWKWKPSADVEASAT